MKNETRSRLFRVFVTVFAVLLFCSPLVFLVGSFLWTKPVYRHTFYGELDDKYDALYSAEGEKIVVVGGSSVAFGYDSQTLSDLFGRPVVNFGLYAALGTKLMLDLSEDAIGEGDVVLLAPELDAETLSLYFNGAATLRALDEKPAMLAGIRRENYPSLFGSLWSVAGEKLRYLKNGAPDPASVYNSRNFNAAGDLVYRRDANAMDGYYDPTTPIIPDESTVSPDFLDYLNAYIDRVEKRGAKVYFAFCPMNAMALTARDENGEEIPLALDALETEVGETTLTVTGVSLDATAVSRCEAFEAFLAQNLHCALLGRMTDFVYPPNYFFDTNFHLNDTGVEWHTRGIGNLLYRAETGTDETPLPRMARLPDLTVPLGDMETVYSVGDLRYRLTYSETFSVVGLSDAGEGRETVVLPPSITVYDAKLDRELTRPVASISSEAFSGATRLQRVVIGDESRMGLIGTRAFAGSSVSELYLFCPVRDFTAGKDMLGGARAGFKIRVGSAVYSDYAADYSWGEISSDVLVETEKAFSDFTDLVD